MSVDNSQLATSKARRLDLANPSTRCRGLTLDSAPPELDWRRISYPDDGFHDRVPVGAHGSHTLGECLSDDCQSSCAAQSGDTLRCGDKLSLQRSIGVLFRQMQFSLRLCGRSFLGTKSPTCLGASSSPSMDAFQMTTWRRC